MKPTLKKIPGEFFDLDNDIKEAREKLRTLQFWSNRRAILARLPDGFVLGCLYDRYRNKLLLKYTGQARDHADARKDMAQARRALNCQSLTYEIHGGYGTDAPRVLLTGIGRIAGKSMPVEIGVPWMRPGCVVRSEIHRENRAFRTYSVTCRI